MFTPPAASDATDRKDIDALKKQLIELGATHVFTYDELSDKAFIKHVKELTGGKVPSPPTSLPRPAYADSLSRTSASS